MSHVYRRPYPAYYWAPTNVEAQPIWEEPYCYREAKPQEWGYGNYGGPYWYYHQPGKDGYSYYGPKYEDWDPRYYEGNAKDFREDFGRGFGRYLRPVYVYPPPPTAAASGPFAFRPFHPGDQFRHPDEYPMRFVPVAYGSASDPCEKEQVKPHCCGCPNHVCHPETRAVKGVERKGLMDRTAEEDVKTKTQNMQDLAGPVVCFNPLEWHGKASENKNRNEGKEEHPVYWIPVNWNRNDGDKEQERWFPGNSVPLDMNSKPLGWGEDKNKLPGYWIPLESSRRPQGWEEHKKKSQFEGNENKNKFPGYWIPLDSIVRPQGEQKDKENSLFEGKSHPFPVLWIPEENLKMASSQEGMKNGGLENRPALVQNVEKEDEKQRVMEEVPVEQIEKGNLKMEGTKNGGLEKEREKINESGTRPVTVQEVGEVNEKQRPQEDRKEIKVRDIPVKQLEEEKSADVQKAKENVMEVKARDIPVKQLEKDKSARVEAQARKAEEKVAENHKVSSPRASKLPPVCLRVDPLPGKRKTNGKSSSRSPSPPKKDNDFTANASTQNIKPGASKIPVESKKAEENASVKASKVAGETKKDDDNASLRASKLGDETKKAGENACLKNSMLNGELEKVDQNLDVQGKNGGNRKTELSRDEAALKIQATYRGCQVRKLEPLRKLHEIAKIRHRMEELKQQIMSPEFEGELSRDDKTRAKMNETLMGLLLQLDTIQGLHPVVRDVRKSLARELVQLQEKLDTLVEGARSSNLQPCMIYETENNVASVEEKNDKDKCLDATEDSCNTLLGTSSENQEVEIEITKDEIAQEKGSVKQDSLEIENAVSNGGKECVFALKNDDSKEETVNTIINDSENVEDNAPVQQEALKVSGNLEIEIPSLSIHLQSEDTTNQDENLANERKSLVNSEEMISTVNDAVEPLHNVTMEKEDKSESALEILPAEKEKKSEPNSLKKQDSPLPSVVDKEICPLSSLAQEQEAEDSDSLNASDDNANTLQKNATLEQGGEVMVIGPEAEASDSLNASDDNANTLQKNATLEQGGEEMVIGSEAEKSKPSPEKDSVDKEENSEAELLKEPNSALPPAVEKDTCKASNQVQKHKVAASDNLNYLEENAITLEKNATLEQGSKMMLIEAEAEKSEPSLEKISVEKGGKSEPNNLEKNSTLEQGGKVMVIGSEAEMSKPSPKNDSVDKDENFEADNLKEPNSALPPAVEIYTCKASTQVQEHEVAASENLNYLDKNATMEQGGKMTLIEAEKSEPSLEIISIEEGEKSEPNNLDEPDSALSLAVEKEICPDNSNTMDGNINVSDKNASLDPEGKVMPIKLEAEPENQISMEEVEVSGAQLDKYESKELEGAFTKTSSQVISDSLSVSHSDCLDETNLNKVEKALNVAEDMSRKGESAAAMAKGSADPIVEKATEALITGDVFSAMSNTKNDFHLQNEENVSKCSRVSDDIESVAPDIMGTLVMDGHKNDVEHSENVRYSAPNISKSERNQDYEKLEEENEKLREIVEKLVEAEKLQMSTIAHLNDKIKHLESKLGKGKKTRKARAGPLRLRSNRGERNTKNAPTLRC